jgi:hypothetical protein
MQMVIDVINVLNSTSLENSKLSSVLFSGNLGLEVLISAHV